MESLAMEKARLEGRNTDKWLTIDQLRNSMLCPICQGTRDYISETPCKLCGSRMVYMTMVYWGKREV